MPAQVHQTASVRTKMICDACAIAGDPIPARPRLGRAMFCVASDRPERGRLVRGAAIRAQSRWAPHPGAVFHCPCSVHHDQASPPYWTAGAVVGMRHGPTARCRRGHEDAVEHCAEPSSRLAIQPWRACGTHTQVEPLAPWPCHPAQLGLLGYHHVRTAWASSSADQARRGRVRMQFDIHSCSEGLHASLSGALARAIAAGQCAQQSRQ